MEKMTLDMIDETFARFEEGKLVHGRVVGVIAKGVLVNIGGKGDAIIYHEDLSEDEVKVGSEVTALVVNKKDENGYVKLSLKAAKDLIRDNDLANSLTVDSVVEVIITNVTKNFISARLGDFTVVIPALHVDFAYKNNLQTYKNKRVKCLIVEVDKKNKNIVGSIRLIRQKEKQDKEDAFWGSLYVSKVVEGEVKRITDFGAFIGVDGHDCLCHISDLSYYKVEKVEDVLKLNEVKQFVVLSFDRETRKISLGYKQLAVDERDEEFNKFKVGQVLVAKVKKVVNTGVILELNNVIDGFMHVSEAGYNVRNLTRKFRLEDEIKVKVIRVNKEERKISLSINALDDYE